jgi:osmoprotectant transport system ATP-binding protein
MIVSAISVRLKHMIRFDGVSKQYPDGTKAVDDLTLEAPTGQITVLVGPSGCGKTTSLRMINRMIEPTGGRILIDDRDTASMNAAELRRGIGYVIQHAGLFPHRTILDNVTTVPKLLGWDKKQARDRARELLDRVGLSSELVDRYPGQLSGGQQQRVGVARALAADPPVMLMDEPFSAVDPIVRHQLQDEFLRLQDELGKTIVFVTHDIDEAIKLGDQVAVLRVGGHLAQLAAPADLLARPVDDFVADFVGRDRGYRALGFARSGEIPVHAEETVRLGSEVSVDGGSADRWVLAVDSDGRPAGWVDRASSDDTGPAEGSRLHRGGTTAKQDGTLREALDAALSSPSSRGVIVDADGRLLGTVTAREVLDLIEARRSDARSGAGAGSGTG